MAETRRCTHSNQGQILSKEAKAAKAHYAPSDMGCTDGLAKWNKHLVDLVLLIRMYKLALRKSRWVKCCCNTARKVCAAGMQICTGLSLCMWKNC